MINTLVTHPRFEGICCISGELKNHYIINVGTMSTSKVKKHTVTPIDTSKCTTIDFNTYKSRVLNVETGINKCIVGNTLREFVGIGWITLGVVSFGDLQKYPRVV